MTIDHDHVLFFYSLISILFIFVGQIDNIALSEFYVQNDT